MERLKAAISDLANLDGVQVDEPGTDSGYTTPTRLWVYNLGRVEISTAAERKEKFFTVSYTWGTMSESDLRAFCQAAGKILGGMNGWVDQLCINQKCAEEKGQEIKRMTNYYASASLNLVLLPGVEGAPRLRYLRRKISHHLSQTETREVGELVTMIGKDKYITRVWTFQEQKLGRESLFMMADGMVPGMELFMLISYWDYRHCEDEPRPSLTLGGMTVFGGQERLRVNNTRLYIKSQSDSLLYQWQQARGRQCTEPKDSLWAFLPLVRGLDLSELDYSESEAVTWKKLAKQGLVDSAWLAVGTAAQEPRWAPKLTTTVPHLSVSISDWPRINVDGDGLMKLEAVDVTDVVTEQGGISAYMTGSMIVAFAAERDAELCRSAKRFWLVERVLARPGEKGGIIIADANSQGPNVYRIGYTVCYVGYPQDELDEGPSWAPVGQWEALPSSSFPQKESSLIYLD